MKIKHCLLFLLGILLTTSMLHANDLTPGTMSSAMGDHVIRGVVLDETGMPLPEAVIRVEGTTISIGSKADGTFTLGLAHKKNYKLLVTFVGYKPQEVMVNTAVESAPLTIRLSPSDTRLDEVVVSGTYIQRPLKDIPILTRVITQKDIQAVNPQDIKSLLTYQLPGIRFGFNSMSKESQISYQGLSGKYILFLVDDERISGEGADHNVDFDRFNIDDIERIEIIKGAQSAMYGSNALGSVINIITKNANRPLSAHLTARYAGYNGQRYSADLGLKKDRFSSYSSLTFRKKNTYTIQDKPSKSHPDEDAQTAYTRIYGYNTWDFTQKLGIDFSEKCNLTIKANTYWNQKDIRHGRLFQEYYVDYNIGAKLKYFIAKGQTLSLGYVYDNYKKDHHFFRIDSTHNNYRNIKQTPRLDYTGIWGKHQVSMGIESDMEDLKHYMLKDSARLRSVLCSFYLQEDWKPSSDLQLIASMRMDYHKFYHMHLTPKISAMWHITPDWTLRTCYAQGFRSPSLKELYMEYDMGGLGWFTIYGNKNLKPETSNQFSLSSEYNHKGLNVSLSLTHNRFTNKITYVHLDSSDKTDLKYVNADKANVTAFEGILRYRTNMGLTLTGAYIYTHDRQMVGGFNTTMVSPHSITFNALYAKRWDKIKFNGAFNSQWNSALTTYTSTEDGHFIPNTYGQRLICSANMGVDLPRGIQLSLGVDNLLNHKDKAIESPLQTPENGISAVATIRLNIANLIGI